jgi:hypothetical protein
MKIFIQTCWVSMVLMMILASVLGAYTIHGDEENPATLMKWHKVEITFDGTSKSESNAATFSDHRLDVEFERPDGTKFWVAGFFAAAGNEADTGNGSGNKWRVRLNPDREGRWSFTARFRTGNWVAVAPMSHPGGTGATAPDGETGTFIVGASAPTARRILSRTTRWTTPPKTDMITPFTGQITTALQMPLRIPGKVGKGPASWERSDTWANCRK